jgi:hypothetical protein
MPVVTSLNATNASFTLTYGNYIDFNTWFIIFLLCLAFILMSRFLNPRDDVGRFIVAGLAFVFGIASIWGSLGLARFDFGQGASMVLTNTSSNQTISYNYIYPVEQVIASNWITILCVVLTIIAFVNGLDIIIRMLERSDEEEERKRRGRGIRI